MGRTKYDINIKPNPNVCGHYMVRFTNETALRRFNKENPEFKPNSVAAHLNEWYPMTYTTDKWVFENLSIEFTYKRSE